MIERNKFVYNKGDFNLDMFNNMVKDLYYNHNRIWDWELPKHNKFPYIVGVDPWHDKIKIPIEGQVFKGSENSNDILDKKSTELASDEINRKYGKEIAKNGEVSLVYEEEFLKLYDFYYDKLTEGE